MGANAYVAPTADNGAAFGAGAAVTGANSVALGAYSSATAANSVALGANSVASQPNTVSVGAPGNERRITNVAAGVAPTDAVNVSQLNGVQNQVTGLSNQVRDVARIAYSGTAMAFAMSGTYLPALSPGEKAVGVGLGNYKGYSAVGLTFKALSEDGRMSWGAGISTTGKEWGVNAGIGWKWR